MTNSRWNKKAIDLMLTELWENAAFLPDSFNEFESFVNEANKDESYAEIFKNLATIRNRYLINQEEQSKLAKTVVAFFGLSVGSHAALTWAMQSRAQRIKIADPDHISATNLNRIRVGYKEIGKSKVDVFKIQLETLTPGIRIDVLKDKSETEMIRICTSSKTDVIIDAVDDLKGKLTLRKVAKKLRIPLIMATDVGNNVFIDIERYDLDRNLPYFLGRVHDVENINFDTLNLRERLELVHKIVGFKEHSARMLWSLLNIGKEVLTWPQLAATATISGGLITTAITKIVTGEKMDSRRYIFNIDGTFAQGKVSKKEEDYRKKLINDISQFKNVNE